MNVKNEVLAGVGLSLVCCYSAMFLLYVTLVPNKHDDDIVLGEFAEFLEPVFGMVEGGGVGQVID